MVTSLCFVFGGVLSAVGLIEEFQGLNIYHFDYWTGRMNLIYSECSSMVSSNKLTAGIGYLLWPWHLSKMGAFPEHTTALLRCKPSSFIPLVWGYLALLRHQ